LALAQWGAVSADVTVYGPNGEDDIHHYKGYTMSSDPDKYGVVADGIYDANYDEEGKSGSLESHWVLNARGPVPDIRGKDPYTGEEDLTGVFIHRSNRDGFAGETTKGGKTVAISKGCLLIDPDQWDDFNKALKGVQNFKVQIDRTKSLVQAMKVKLEQQRLDWEFIDNLIRTNYVTKKFPY
jgi:hypothetical protein